MVPLAAACLLWIAPAEAQDKKPKRQRDVITREEIMESAQSSKDAFEAVRSIRPHFLAPPRGVRSLGSTRPAATVVYVDGTRMGEIDVLRSILAVHVAEVRYLEPAKAQDEFGITHSGGAILVKLFRPSASGSPKDSVGR